MNGLRHLEVMGPLTIIHLKLVVLLYELSQGRELFKAKISNRVFGCVVMDGQIMLRKIPLSVLIHTVGE